MHVKIKLGHKRIMANTGTLLPGSSTERGINGLPKIANNKKIIVNTIFLHSGFKNSFMNFISSPFL
jgi:hypothetical protein